MKIKISALILVVVYTVFCMGGICALADDEYITWTRLTEMNFTRAEYDDGQFAFPVAYEKTVTTSFPAGGGYKVSNKNGTQEVMNINVPSHGITESQNKYKAGIKFETDRGGESPVYSLFIYGSNGFLGAIRILGEYVCFANSTSTSGVYLTVPVKNKVVTEAAIMFDPVNMILTPMVNGVPVGETDTYSGTSAYSGGIPDRFESSFWLNWSSSNYMHFRQLFIDEGYDATQECNYEALTDEKCEKITENLNLMTSLDNGAEVSWESSKPSVIAPDGTVTRQDNDEQVTLTADILYNSQHMLKKFKFIVLGQDKLENNFILEESDFNTDAPYYSFVTDGGTAGVKNGKLLLSKEQIDEASAEKYFVSNLAESPYAVKADKVIFEQYLSAGGAFDTAECSVRNDKNKPIAYIDIENTGAGNYELQFRYKDSVSSIPYNENDEIYVKLTINSDDNTCKLFVNNTELEPSTVKYTLADAGISSVKYELKGSAGSMSVDNSALMIYEPDKEKAKVTLDAANVRYADLTQQSPDKITGNLTFNKNARFGSLLSYKTSDGDTIDENGFVMRGGEDKNVTVTVNVKNGDNELNKEFPFTVKGRDMMNLAIDKPTTVSGEKKGNEASYAVDWLNDTAWKTADASRFIVISFGKEEIFNNVYLREAKDENSSYGVKKFTIETSNNARSWKKVYEGSTIGEELTAEFGITTAKYIRYTAAEIDGNETGLYELGVYYRPDSETAIKLDFEDIKIPGDYEVSKDLELIKNGKYGSAVSWKSSKPEIISDEGKLLGKPDYDTVVTLTATVRNGDVTKTKDFKRLVEGKYKSTPKTSGGGGGGASRSPVRGITNSGIITSPGADNADGNTEEETQKNGFNDVSENRWSYNYIAELKEAGIVSGDGRNFRPEANVTREEFVKMLLLSLGIESEGTAQFEDVESGSWYEPYISTAVEKNIIQGISETRFGTGRYISRQDMAVMAVRALEASEKSISTSVPQIFTDSDEIADYAKSAVELLSGAGILAGDGGRIFAGKELTREQAAKVLCMLRKEIAQ